MEKQNEEINEVLDFNKPDFSFVPKGSHDWRQQGPFITCKTCDLEHGVYIGINKRMTGMTEDGKPILTKL